MEITCPSCSGSIDTDPSYAGQTFACPHCGTGVTIPGVPPQRSTSGLAVASLVTALLGMFPLAIIFGHVARGKISRDPSQGGEGIALAGLILGYVSIVLVIPFIAIIASISVPAFQTAQAQALVNRDLSDMKQLSAALRVYANENDGLYPDTLEELVPEYCDESMLKPRRTTGEGANEPFTYYPGHDDSSRFNTIILASPEVRRRRAYITVSGSGKVVRTREFEELIRDQR